MSSPQPGSPNFLASTTTLGRSGSVVGEAATFSTTTKPRGMAQESLIRQSDQERARTYLRSLLSGGHGSKNKFTSQMNLGQWLFENKIVFRFDQKLRLRNIIMAVIGIIQCILMVAMLEYPYNDTTHIYEETSELEYLELVQLILTIVLVYCIYDYYRLLVNIERVEFNLPGNISVLRSAHMKSFLLELLICIPHPFPFAGLRKLGMIMFLRLYLLLRVYRDFSEIYRWRKDIVSTGEIGRDVVQFDSSLSIRALLYRSPWFSVAFITGTSLCVFAYAIYISERDSPFIKYRAYNDNFSRGMLTSMGTALWYASSTMALLGYGDIYVVTRWGQAFTALLSLWGICIGGLVITTFVMGFALDFNEKFAADFAEVKRLAIMEADLAARVLQVWFRECKQSGRLRRYRKLKRDAQLFLQSHAVAMWTKKITAEEKGCCGPPVTRDPLITAAQEFKRYRLMVANELGQEDVTQLKHILTLKRSADLTAARVVDMRALQEELEEQTRLVTETLIKTLRQMVASVSESTGQQIGLNVDPHTGEVSFEREKASAQVCYVYP